MSKGKRPTRKRQPGGMTILHEDKDIIVVVKPAGLLTIATEREKTKTAHYLLNDYVRKGNAKSRNRVYIVHRLDKDTSGILIFAKSEQAKKYLQGNWPDTEKHYLGIVHGHLTAKEATITSHLFQNKAQRVYSTNDPGKGKLSHTDYKVLEESEGFSLIDINLLTGRKHQIRVHFAEKGHPIVGDKKYGNKDRGVKRLALHARSISFSHPFNHKTMTFDTGIPDDFARLFRKL
ncbi:MAG: RluA family pseudouridine synthase [Proteobacteria bacterium]|nr:RluA family pseudouridine synthase [Pseudomonadota bacterium]